MKVEDFTYVLPEDKPIHRKRNQELFNKIYDLDEANRRSIYFNELRKQILEAENQAKQRYYSKLIV